MRSDQASFTRDVELGDLDAYVTNDYGEANRIWINDGHGAFSHSGNSLGNAYSKDVSLGDVDGDGDLDAFIANANSEPNRVWLNVTTDRDSDGVPDAIDNCPSIGNPGWENLDGDALGNACDDDVDGDNSCVPPGGQDENDCDPDDDNDGLLRPVRIPSTRIATTTASETASTRAPGYSVRTTAIRTDRKPLTIWQS